MIWSTRGDTKNGACSFHNTLLSSPMLVLSFTPLLTQQIFTEDLPHSNHWGSAVEMDREYHPQGGREAQGGHHIGPGSHWWLFTWLFPLRMHAAPWIFILYLSEDKSTPRRKFLNEKTRGSSGGENVHAKKSEVSNNGKGGGLLRMESVLAASFADPREESEACPGREEGLYNPFNLRI